MMMASWMNIGRKRRDIVKLHHFLLIGAAILGSACTQAKTPAELGKEKSTVCQSCHGSTGKADIPIYPNIAGQNAPYLEMSLKAYRDQSRKGLQADAMYGIAAGLSDEDIKNLAAYFSGQK
tara:strand:- start:54 stop:416 length:363 start_codon:yes stop_codon:yes gene_type:complete